MSTIAIYDVICDGPPGSAGCPALACAGVENCKSARDARASAVCEGFTQFRDTEGTRWAGPKLRDLCRACTTAANQMEDDR